jgi:Cu2+-containing amine oxidase
MIDVVKETGLVWDPLAFTSLHVRDAALKNSLGHASEWHLMPTRDGTPSHQEAFTRNAFWVTRYRWNEMAGNDLPTYVSNAEAVANNDVVLWYYGGLHHHVRDEDTDMTQLMWVGFMLKPYDVWSKTPLFP